MNAPEVNASGKAKLLPLGGKPLRISLACFSARIEGIVILPEYEQLFDAT
jgi:hypothetical protein